MQHGTASAPDAPEFEPARAISQPVTGAHVVARLPGRQAARHRPLVDEGLTVARQFIRPLGQRGDYDAHAVGHPENLAGAVASQLRRRHATTLPLPLDECNDTTSCE